jgi:hypothetical protein
MCTSCRARGATRSRRARLFDEPLRHAGRRSAADRGAARTLRFPIPLGAAPRPPIGSEIVLGVPPGNMRLGGSSAIPAELVVEPTGYKTQVTARLGGEDFVCVFRERFSGRPGENIALSWTAARCTSSTLNRAGPSPAGSRRNLASCQVTGLISRTSEGTTPIHGAPRSVSP